METLFKFLHPSTFDIIIALLTFLAGRLSGFWGLFLWADILILKIMKDKIIHFLIIPSHSDSPGKGI